MAEVISKCEFCGGPATLLCYARIYSANGKQFRVPIAFINGKTHTCDKHVCRSCAKKISDIHLKIKGGCRWDTRDLCPLCQQAEERPVEVS